MIVAVVAALTVQAPPVQTPRDVVVRAVAMMGGEAALRGVTAVATEFYTVTLGLGQEETPRAQPRANVGFGRTLTHHAGRRQVNTIELRNPTGAVNRLRRVTAGGISMTETNGRQAPDGAGLVANIETGWRRAPDRLLLAAFDNPGALAEIPTRTLRGESYLGVRYAAGLDTVNLYFDQRSGLLAAIEAPGVDDGILGDRRTATWYTRWQEVPGTGVRYFRQTEVEANGRLQSHSVLTAVTLNPPTPDSLFVIPDSIATRAPRAAPPPAAPPAVVVTLNELGPGVWRAEGGSHHSLVVEQPGRLVVVEAPQSTDRSLAVRDTLRGRFPGRAMGLVVNTHHHWDHAGGLRAYLAAGVPAVTHGRNVAFVRSIAVAHKVVRPDELSREGSRPPVITAVEDSLTIGTGASRVIVYRFPTAHVEGMLVAFIPSARILFQSDIVSPGPTMAATGAREIVAFVRARGLAVDRVAGGHGGVAAFAEVERAAQQP